MNSEAKFWICLSCCVGLRVYSTLSRREETYEDHNRNWEIQFELDRVLLDAIGRGDCDSVKQSFATNHNIFKPAVLTKALDCGHPDVLDLVLATMRFSEGEVLHHHTLQNKCSHAVYVLLLKHGYLNSRTVHRYLHVAVCGRDEPAVKLCLSVARQTGHLKAPATLMRACSSHSPQLVKLLLDADIDLRTSRGSILDSVSNQGWGEKTVAADLEIVRLLMEAHCGATRLKRHLHAPSVGWALANRVLFDAFLRYGRNSIAVCRFAKRAAESNHRYALERVLMSSNDPRLLCHIRKSVSAQCKPLLRLLHHRFETIRLVNLVLLLKPLQMPVLVIYHIYKTHPLYCVNSLVPRYDAWNLIKSISHRDSDNEKIETKIKH